MSQQNDTTKPTESDEAHADRATTQEESHDEKGGRISALANETRILAADIKEWVDLRVRLVQLEIEERIEKLANQLISLVIVIVLGLFSALFLLMALAVWIGGMLDSLALGYTIVGAFLLVVTVLIHTMRPRFMKSSAEGEDLPALESSKPDNQHVLPATGLGSEGEEA